MAHTTQKLLATVGLSFVAACSSTHEKPKISHQDENQDNARGVFQTQNLDNGCYILKENKTGKWVIPEQEICPFIIKNEVEPQ